MTDYKQRKAATKELLARLAHGDAINDPTIERARKEAEEVVRPRRRLTFEELNRPTTV